MDHLLLFLLIFKVAFQEEYGIVVVFAQFMLEQRLLLLKIPCVLLLQLRALLVELLLLGFESFFLIHEAVVPLQSTGVILDIKVFHILPITLAPHGIVVMRLGGAGDVWEYLDLRRQQVVIPRIPLQCVGYFVSSLLSFLQLLGGSVEDGVAIVRLGAATQLLLHHQFWIVPVRQQRIAHLLQDVDARG